MSGEQGLLDELCGEYSTWGRFGHDDDRGHLNYVTPDKVVAAARLVKKGTVFSLAIALDEHGPQTGAFGRTNPWHFMTADGSDVAAGGVNVVGDYAYTDDAVLMGLQCGTQWDALAHAFHRKRTYNGRGTETVTSTGATRGSITVLNERSVGRGVLLDVARHLGLPWLAPGQGIDADELEACARQQGTLVGEGDFVLIRTGQLANVRARGGWDDYVGGPAPGLTLSAATFLCERRVAAVAADTCGVEVKREVPTDVFGSLHTVLLVYAGIHMGEIFDLERLAEDCAVDGVYEFLFVAPPLLITGAVGSPVNPQAIK